MHGERRDDTGFWWGSLTEGDQLGSPGVDGRIKLKWNFEVGWGGMDWIDVT